MPTFPNARYHLPAVVVDFWDPANGHATVLGPAAQSMWEDSMVLVFAAGQVHQWRDRARIDDSPVLEAAPGHLGGSVLRLIA